MRKTLALAALAMALEAISAHAAIPTSHERQALEALAQKGDAIWNTADAGAMSRIYTADGTLMLTGMAKPIEGREAVKSYFTTAFAQRQGELRHITTMKSAELISPDVAFVDNDVRIELKNADGSYTVVRRFANEAIAVRKKGAWQLRTVRAHILPADPKKS